MGHGIRSATVESRACPVRVTTKGLVFGSAMLPNPAPGTEMLVTNLRCQSSTVQRDFASVVQGYKGVRMQLVQLKKKGGAGAKAVPRVRLLRIRLLAYSNKILNDAYGGIGRELYSPGRYCGPGGIQNMRFIAVRTHI